MIIESTIILIIIHYYKISPLPRTLTCTFPCWLLSFPPLLKRGRVARSIALGGRSFLDPTPSFLSLSLYPCCACILGWGYKIKAVLNYREIKHLIPLTLINNTKYTYFISELTTYYYNRIKYV